MCFSDHTWTLHARHVLAAILWVGAVVVTVVGFHIGNRVVGNVGIVLAGIAVAYTVCASNAVTRAALRETFELGRAAEARRLHRVPEQAQRP